MNCVNKVLLIGNLGNDPILSDTPSGKTVASFNLATNEFLKEDENGEKITRTDWHKITAWGKTAEACRKMLNKGSQVLVEGKIRNYVLTINNIESKHYEVFATRIIFISNYGSKKEAEKTLAS